jgi:C-terminal processing protease CtpA/Prc
MPAFREKDGVWSVPFVDGTAAKLRDVAQRSASLTLDLRNNPLGSYDAMRACLQAVAPDGDYGTFVHPRGKGQPLTVKGGNPKPPKIKLLVDGSTRGPAEIFATALAAKGLATLSGAKMGGDLSLLRTTELQDGSGYTLAVGDYRAPQAKAVKR